MGAVRCYMMLKLVLSLALLAVVFADIYHKHSEPTSFHEHHEESHSSHSEESSESHEHIVVTPKPEPVYHHHVHHKVPHKVHHRTLGGIHHGDLGLHHSTVFTTVYMVFSMVLFIMVSMCILVLMSILTPSITPNQSTLQLNPCTNTPNLQKHHCPNMPYQ